MANPNIVAVTSITGNTTVVSVNTSLQAIVTNTANSNTVVKLNTLRVTNKVSSAANISVSLGKQNSYYSLASNISVPNNSSFIVITKADGFYLMEGDNVSVISYNTIANLDAVCSFEVLQ